MTPVKQRENYNILPALLEYTNPNRFRRILQYIETNNMNNAYLPGFVDNALEFLPDFDVFLLPSQFEGFPLTVLECMHAAVPLVAYNVGGNSR